LVAFKLALAEGAAGIELDVRLARDGVPVVIHDATLRRTGVKDGVVARMASTELGRADVGSWFSRLRPSLARTEYARQSVPTLSQVFDLFKQRTEIIYVEMKTEKAEETYLELAGSVAQLIGDHDFSRRVVVVSFNLEALTQIKIINPSIVTGALFEPRRSPVKTLRKHPMIKAALDCGAREILLHRLVASEKLVALAAENDLRPVVWTVDEPAWLRRRVGYGIHALITNNPALMSASI
jgi:glycerophosphoryl diester phosphodiesterase